MISLDVALDRLLHRPGVLAEFLARGPDALDVSPADSAALAAVDRAELARTATRIREGLFRKQHRGSGGLLALYPRTIAAHRAAHPDDVDLAALAAALLESAAFDDYREVPFAGAGTSLEEAFFRFAEAQDLGAADVREAEFLAALLRALAVSPRPDFTLPDAVRRAPAGFFAVSARSGPTLFAALGGRFVTGPITPFLAELLRAGASPEVVAARHGVAAPALAASLAELTALGLVGG